MAGLAATTVMISRVRRRLRVTCGSPGWSTDPYLGRGTGRRTVSAITPWRSVSFRYGISS